MSPHNFFSKPNIFFLLKLLQRMYFNMAFLLSLKYQHENGIQFLSHFDWRRHSFLYLFSSNITLSRLFSNGLVGDILQLWVVCPIASVSWKSLGIVYSWKHFPSTRPQNESCDVGRRLSTGFPNFCYVASNPQKLINYASLFWFVDFKKAIFLVIVTTVSFKQVIKGMQVLEHIQLLWSTLLCLQKFRFSSLSLV